MTLTKGERTRMREQVAATLATRGHAEANHVLDQLEFPTTDRRDRSPTDGELEEHILRALERDDDDERLEELDFELHGRTMADELSEVLDAVREIPGAPSSGISILAEEEHYLLFSETRNRIKAVAVYLNLLEVVLASATSLADPKDVYEAKRRQRYPYLKSTPIDFEEVAHKALMAEEFPLLAWGPMFIYCFSVLERFLSDAAAIAAHERERTVPSKMSRCVIESWLRVLESLGFTLKIAPQTMNEIKALRPLRNNLAHRLSLSARDMPQDLPRDPETDTERPQPTPDLVRRALRAVHDIVSVAEAAFGTHSLDDSLNWYPNPGNGGDL